MNNKTPITMCSRYNFLPQIPLYLSPIYSNLDLYLIVPSIICITFDFMIYFYFGGLQNHQTMMNAFSKCSDVEPWPNWNTWIIESSPISFWRRFKRGHLVTSIKKALTYESKIYFKNHNDSWRKDVRITQSCVCQRFQLDIIFLLLKTCRWQLSILLDCILIHT